jgi:hypothetical protein
VAIATGKEGHQNIDNTPDSTKYLKQTKAGKAFLSLPRSTFIHINLPEKICHSIKYAMQMQRIWLSSLPVAPPHLVIESTISRCFEQI